MILLMFGVWKMKIFWFRICYGLFCTGPHYLATEIFLFLTVPNLACLSKLKKEDSGQWGESGTEEA